jgi:hypothetical protein
MDQWRRKHAHRRRRGKSTRCIDPAKSMHIKKFEQDFLEAYWCLTAGLTP